MKPAMKFASFFILLAFLSAKAPAQQILRIYPGNPYQGGSLDIEGSGFANSQGAWRVSLFRIVNRQVQHHYCSVLSWSTTRIVVEVPADLPPHEYVLKLLIPDSLHGSNETTVTVRERPANQPPPSMAPWISRAHVTVQYELWIYGRHFGFQAGNHGIPTGARAVFYGNQGETDLRIIEWLDDLVKTWLPPRCEPGVYEVAIIKGVQAWNRSNRMNVTIRPEMVGQEHPANVPGFMHIDAARPLPILRGRQFTILGNHFDVYRREANNFLRRIGQGRRVVQLVDVQRGNARAHDCTVFSSNPATDPDYLDQGNLQWFDDHIIATAPSDLEPGEFLLRILDRADNRSSNTLAVRVVRNYGDAMHIESVTVSPIMAGGVRELTIRGRNFGRSRGRGLIDINPGNPGFLVQDWSDERIRLQLCYTVAPGRYSICVFADESRMDGSNRVAFDVKGHMQIDRVSFLDLRENNVKELALYGRYFGESRGQRVIDINPSTRTIVREWADNEIRIRLSFDISPGRYSIRILEGGDYPGGSNTVHFNVPANRP
jgi:hypothetical protein